MDHSLSLDDRSPWLPIPAMTRELCGALRGIPTGPAANVSVPGGTRIEIGYGHPIADELRSLGLTRRPLITMWTII